MGAGRVVETLSRTGGFGAKVARHRMFESKSRAFSTIMRLTASSYTAHLTSHQFPRLHQAWRGWAYFLDPSSTITCKYFKLLAKIGKTKAGIIQLNILHPWDRCIDDWQDLFNICIWKSWYWKSQQAAVRRRILKLATSRPKYYSIEEFGVPINDLEYVLVNIRRCH